MQLTGFMGGLLQWMFHESLKIIYKVLSVIMFYNMFFYKEESTAFFRFSKKSITSQKLRFKKL